MAKVTFDQVVGMPKNGDTCHMFISHDVEISEFNIVELGFSDFIVIDTHHNKTLNDDYLILSKDQYEELKQNIKAKTVHVQSLYTNNNLETILSWESPKFRPLEFAYAFKKFRDEVKKENLSGLKNLGGKFKGKFIQTSDTSSISNDPEIYEILLAAIESYCE